LANLKTCHKELKMKMQVDVEALEEQLRVRKEKQYKLVERAQSLEEGKRQAEERVISLETQGKNLHERIGELTAQLQQATQVKK
jgi:myosin protein heavy chain